MWKKIKFYSVSALIIVLAAVALYYRTVGPRGGGIHRLADAPALVQEIQRLNELVTVKYTIQKVIGLEEEKVPFGSEKLLLMVQARVLGGVDLSALTPQDIEVTPDKAVTIKLPPPKVLHVFVDEKQTKVWDRKVTWWTPWVPFNPELDQKARLAALEAVQAATLEMGILHDAQQNAEAAIRELLRHSGAATVTFHTGAAPVTLPKADL
jgi:hypothetical protein